jgi:hypothetical protein
MTESDKAIYLIYAGTGKDGGFGDYAGVNWSSAPVKVDGETVWFEEVELAETLVKSLNEASSNVFYSEAKYEKYDGMFPLEYEVRKIVIPSNNPSTVDNFQKIFAAQKNRWDDPELDSDDDYAELEKRRTRRRA